VREVHAQRMQPNVDVSYADPKIDVAQGEPSPPSALHSAVVCMLLHSRPFSARASMLGDLIGEP
jgi:hypothetical protein